MDILQKVKWISLSIIVSLVSLPAFGQTSSDYQKTHQAKCGQHYIAKAVPQLLTDKHNEIYYLCFEGFAIGYSAISKTALWSAEHLTKARIEQANTLARVDNFHEESQLPDRVKAYLSDYKNVPYDRGHLAPNADMATVTSQYDSFSLANMIPQHPKNNRGTWRSIESRTRYLAVRYGEVYVVTGVAFNAPTIKKIHHRVMVPTHLYKAIYVPSLRQAGVYYVPNDDSQRVETISLNELALRTGIDSMPVVPSNIQRVAMPLRMDDNLTTPKQPNSSDKPTDKQTSQLLVVIMNLLLALLGWLASLLQA